MLRNHLNAPKMFVKCFCNENLHMLTLSTFQRCQELCKYGLILILTLTHIYRINFNGHTMGRLVQTTWLDRFAFTFTLTMNEWCRTHVLNISISTTGSHHSSNWYIYAHSTVWIAHSVFVCVCRSVGRCVYVLLIVYTLFERIPTKITNEAKQIEEKQQQSQRIKKNQRQLLRKQTILWWLVVLCC